LSLPWYKDTLQRMSIVCEYLNEHKEVLL
jgi:hypothetical protein